jgi:beta-phosphoglucomutase-like phosphatase (HAD superfamily)
VSAIPFELVVLDCDGVLVDSEPISNRVLAEHLTALGVPTTTEESIERSMGGSLQAVVADVEARLGRPAPATLVPEYRAAVYAAPARCAVVEDSPVGVAAALAAGMAVFGYAGPGRTPPERLAREGVTVFASMAGLPELLARGVTSS